MQLKAGEESGSCKADRCSATALLQLQCLFFFFKNTVVEMPTCATYSVEKEDACFFLQVKNNFEVFILILFMKAF